MRSLIYNLLTSSEEFMATIPGGLYGDRSLSSTPAEKPFAVTMYEGPSKGMGNTHRLRLVLWVHDETGDYTRIDNALYVAREVLESAVQQRHEGVWLNQVSWETDSVDLYDDQRGTNTKNATFLVVGNGL